MKVTIKLSILLSALLTPLLAQSAQQAGDWSLNELTDDDGSIIKVISTISKNDLIAKNKKSKLELRHQCNKNFSVKSNNISFATDDVDCGPFGCKKIQTSSLRYGFKETNAIKLDILDNGTEMTLLSANSELTKAMKRHKNITLELEASDTNNKQQMATFSLMGFTKAYNWCSK